MQVEWHQGNALEPKSYAHLLPGVSAVVHTIGTLFEKSGYKSALKDGNVPRVVSDVAAGVAGAGRGANPLEREEKKREGSYELLNRDTGACVVAAAAAVSSKDARFFRSLTARGEEKEKEKSAPTTASNAARAGSSTTARPRMTNVSRSDPVSCPSYL